VILSPVFFIILPSANRAIVAFTSRKVRTVKSSIPVNSRGQALADTDSATENYSLIPKGIVRKEGDGENAG
jgi:hypothetical protein